MKSLVILISGRGSNMAAVIRETQQGILKGICHIKAVFSNNPQAEGIQKAKKYNLPVKVISSKSLHRKDYNEQLLNWLLNLKPDFIILAGYMKILPPAVIKAFPRRIINIHPADTKKHQGLHGYEWAWQNKLKETKVTVHYVDEGLDTGSIIKQQKVNLAGAASLQDVEKRGLHAEHQLYSSVIASLCSASKTNIKQDEIAIIDFGGQYTHLIARRIRQKGVFSEIYQPEEFILKPSIVGIIFSGGPQSVKEESAYSIDLDIRQISLPVLGICYGHQLIAQLTGGEISSSKPEYGLTQITCINENSLFSTTPPKQNVWMSHGDQVTALANDFKTTAWTDSVPIAACESADGRIMGVQFHPEVTHTEFGSNILDNFLNRCTAKRDWQPRNFKKQLVSTLRKQAADKNVLILLSGGVDSLVAMELCLAALGKERVFAIHVDTGFMRLKESENIICHLKELGYRKLKLISAEDIFLNELANVVEPEHKRLIIGRLFAEIADNALREFAADNFLLVQGTIYPDTIESGSSKKAAKIKTHHNRVGEIEKMIAEGRIIEPIKDLYKDEVRQLGRELNIPENLVNRHPFPGPGLAIRILASPFDTPEKNFDKEKNILQKIAAEFQLHSLVLPVKSVGVMGDFRTYMHPALLWLNSGMKSPPDNDFWNDLQKAASIIVNNLKTVNRVALSILNTEPKYNLRKHLLSKKACDNLRLVDDFLMQNTAHISEIWQMPVVQLPLFDDNGRQVYLMRPVTSRDAMTADFYKMDFMLLKQLVQEARSKFNIADILYDITSKPPATIEWE